MMLTGDMNKLTEPGFQSNNRTYASGCDAGMIDFAGELGNQFPIKFCAATNSMAS